MVRELENLERVEKTSNSEDAYQHLYSRLCNGLIGQDDRIVDTALAVELNMSRMPAREALLRLVSEGYLVRSTRGFRLPTLEASDILEIFDIRKLLEPRAAALAAGKLSENGRRELCAAHQDALSAFQSADVHALFSANVRFRNAWLNAVPNQRLVGTISRFFVQVNAVRLATLHDAGSRRQSILGLNVLVEAFCRADSLEVLEQMQIFIENAREQFLRLNASD